MHNRWLRNCFDKRLSQSVDTSDAAYKRSLEYLFLGQHPALPGEMERAVEHGFKTPAALAAMVSGKRCKMTCAGCGGGLGGLVRHSSLQQHAALHIACNSMPLIITLFHQDSALQVSPEA